MIDKSGIYTISNEDYHADPCAVPSLTRGTIKDLLTLTPAHVFARNKRLNPKCITPEKEEKFDVGTFAHALFLEGEDAAAVFDHKDWRKGEAKQDREDARAAGKIPFLRHQYTQVCDMVESAHRQLAQAEECPIKDLYEEGKTEESYIWNEDDIWCRCRPDWRSNDYKLVIDYKTCDCADPSAWGGKIADMGYDIQDVWYRRGIKAVAKLEKSPRFIFMVQETTPPFLCSFIALPPEFIAMAEEKVKYGTFLWNQCLTFGEWPGYPKRICYADVKPWALAQWECKKFEIDEVTI